MKECYRCKKTKTDLEFSKSSSHKDGLHSYCKFCQKEMDQQYWHNKKKNPKRMKQRRQLIKQRLEEAREYVFQYLLQHPCKCGETNPLFLEFDHLGKKKQSISDMVGSKLAVESIRREIEQCQVLCIKCHRFKTAKEFDWWIIKRYNKLQGMA